MEINKFYSGRDPSDIPFYSQRDIAAAVKIPYSTLRRWLLPLSGTSHGEGYDAPLIIGPQGAYGRLSFTNLAEAYMIAELRRKTNVGLREIRKAVWFLRHKFGISRPLFDNRLWAGSGIYMDHEKGLIDLSRTGQFVFEEVVRAYLSRVEIDPSGMPRQLYPWVMNTEKKNVLIDPRIRFGQPVIAGTGIMTLTIHERFEAGETLDAIARSYEIDDTLVKDALAYEVGP